MLSKTIPTDSSCYTNSENVEFNLSTTYRFVVIEETVKGQDFASIGVKYVQMLQFCWQWSQNARLLKTIQMSFIFFDYQILG